MVTTSARLEPELNGFGLFTVAKQFGCPCDRHDGWGTFSGKEDVTL